MNYIDWRWICRLSPDQFMHGTSMESICVDVGLQIPEFQEYEIGGLGQIGCLDAPSAMPAGAMCCADDGDATSMRFAYRPMEEWF